MYFLKTEHSFDSAHFLQGYDGKCRNIHGHRWRVVVTIQSESLKDSKQERGMILDFGDFKQDLKTMIDFYDHALLIEKGSLSNKLYEALLEENFKLIELPFRPTAENMAKFFYDELSKQYRVDLVEVYETPNNCASYRGDNHE
ncbi:MAG: 6-carboxytetrahydropterin synthase QueD [Clostridiales bacterium]|nr:6-carboxytetrahydropterin synthase QueD [Clostridiales bacterium]